MVKFIGLLLISLFAVKTLAVELPTPPTTAQAEYQLVIANYGEDALSTQVQEKLATAFLTALGKMSLNTLSVDSMKNLQMNFKGFHDQLALALEEVNEQLPDDVSVPLNLVYLPLDKESLVLQNAELQSFPIAGPLAVVAEALAVKTLALSNGDTMGDVDFDWYTSVSNSLALHNQYMSQQKDSAGFYFSALQLQLNLQKDNSSMQLQGMIGLNGQSVALDKVNEQVRIQDLVVPSFTQIIDQNAGVSMAEAPGYLSQAPMVVMSTAFEQADADRPLELSMALGAFNGLGGNDTGIDVVDEFALAGTALPSEIGPQLWLTECQDRMKSVPALNGTIAQGAVGGGTLGKLVEKANVAIAFHFFNLWFQFNEAGEPYLPPGNLDIRVSVAGGLAGYGECVVMGDVNEQLSDELNSTIKAQLEELLKVDSLADELLSQF